KDEGPVAAGVLIEGAVRHHDSSRSASQLDLEVDRLADMDVGRRGAAEIEIHLEGPVADLGIDLGDLGPKEALGEREQALLSESQAPQVELVDLRGQLEAIGGVDLAQHRAL